MLVAPSAGFFSPGAPDYDYHLIEISPAVDQAIGSTTPDDIDGETRGQAPDIGADERTGPAEALFWDGFETGDLRRWSSSAP